MADTSVTTHPIPSANPDVLEYNVKRIDEVVNSDNTTYTDRSGQERKTIFGLTKEFNSAIQAAGGVPIGVWTAGVTEFNAYNEYAVYNGIPYKPRATTALPYTAQGADPTVAPDAGNVQPYQEVELIRAAEERLLGLGATLYKGRNGSYVQNGDVVEPGVTHLSVPINGKPENATVIPPSSGVVSSLDDFSATIGGVSVLLAYSTRGSVVNIKDFGADPNGVENINTSIQLAKNALNPGDTLYIPSGNYFFAGNTITFTSLSDFKIICDGVIVVDNSTSSAVVVFSDCHDGDVNINISGSRAAGIVFRDGSSNITVHNCNIKDLSQVFWMWDCSHISIASNTLTNCGYGVIQQVGYSSSNCKVIGNTFNGSRSDCVELNCEGNAFSSNWIIANNVATDIGYSRTDPPSLQTECRFLGATYVDNLIIANNTVDGCAGDSAIHLEKPGNIVIIGNNMRNCHGTSGGGRFIYLLPSLSNIPDTTDVLNKQTVSIIGNSFVIADDNLVNETGTNFISASAVVEQNDVVVTGNSFTYYGSGYPAEPANNFGTGLDISFSYQGSWTIKDNIFRNLERCANVRNTLQGSPSITTIADFIDNKVDSCDVGLSIGASSPFGAITGNTFYNTPTPLELDLPNTIRIAEFGGNKLTGSTVMNNIALGVTRRAGVPPNIVFDSATSDDILAVTAQGAPATLSTSIPNGVPTGFLRVSSYFSGIVNLYTQRLTGGTFTWQATSLWVSLRAGVIGITEIGNTKPSGHNNTIDITIALSTNDYTILAIELNTDQGAVDWTVNGSLG